MNNITTTSSEQHALATPRGMGFDVGRLSHSHLAERLSYDKATGVITWKVSPVSRIPAGSVAGSTSDKGYTVIVCMGRLYQAHRIAWLLTHGTWPDGDIDHINGIRSDNRIANLRDVSRSVNQQNLKRARRDNQSGLLGVKQTRSGSFEARINVHGRYVHIGTYPTAHEAHAAYLSAKRNSHQGCTL